MKSLARGVVLMLAAVVLAIPAPASAVVTCSYSSATHAISVDLSGNTGVGIVRSGNQIFVGGSACVQLVPVVSATVMNTDAIEIEGLVGNNGVDIDLAGGPFAPGFSDEAGTSDEIEFSVDLQGSDNVLRFFGRGGSDDLRAGEPGSAIFVNLNAGEGTGIDSDVSVSPVPDSFLFDTRGGSDLVMATGSAGTGGPMTGTVNIDGGGGDDTLVGGEFADVLFDGDGKGDRDVLRGGMGLDVLDAKDGDRLDVLKGGPDSDNCVADGRDRKRTCP